jgi:hypothetical protein
MLALRDDLQRWMMQMHYLAPYTGASSSTEKISEGAHHHMLAADHRNRQKA